jgi:membrane-associated phospholipid phosphatase
MKNSTLIFRSIALISSVLFAWFHPIATLLILLILLALGIFAYLVFCVLELNKIRGEYSNKEFEYVIVPRKYNIIALFIDWVNSFPSIIKKKDLEE